MSGKRFSKVQIFLFIILGSIAVHFIFFRALSEEGMIRKFHLHKAEFEEIRSMLQQDKNIQTIGPDWVRGQWVDGKGELPLNISEDRLALYRSRLKGLGFSRVDSYEGRVQLAEFGGGFTDTSWSIGYMWLKDTPKALVKSAYNEMPAGVSRHFSHLEGDWYIYHTR